jgi:hypothetical protein
MAAVLLLLRSATRSPVGIRTLAGELWHVALQAMLDPYRPELHYMRGPGPKWQEKHRSVAGR